MRPLDRISSIKVKLSIVIVLAVLISALISTIGYRAGIAIWLRPLIAGAIALLVAYPIARGITSPLREMASASKAMVDGDFDAPVAVTSRDEVGELARAFVQMRSELSEVDRQRQALIANVAHELRTPLTALRARLENVVDGVEPNDTDHAQASLHEVERLSELVDRVLDLSRLESGASPLHVEQFDVEPLLHEAAWSASHGGDTARVVVTAADGLVYRGDRARVHQVVTNLVDNALRCSPPERPVLVEASSNGGCLHLCVTDEGPGIPAGDRDHVFERFYRTDDARSHSAGGSGLGLAIVAEIVQLHGGSVEVATDRSEGCTVVVVLPHVTGAHP